MHRSPRTPFGVTLVILILAASQPAAQEAKPAKAFADPAIAEGLKWLASKQADDGSWTLASNKFEGTGLAVLAFLGAGHTHKPGKEEGLRQYTKNVDRGLKFLLLKQNRDGVIDPEEVMGQAIATAALAEAYALTSDPALRGPVQRAINQVIDAQNPKGGWGKKKKEETTISSTAWNLLALKAAQTAGLTIPPASMKKIGPAIDELAADQASRFAESGTEQPTLRPTAMGLLCRLQLGAGPKDVKRGADKLAGDAPKDLSDPTTTYFATQVMHHAGKQSWDRWQPALRELLTKTQDKGKDAATKGSWAPPEADDSARLRTTALALLCLEVPYRHLAVFRKAPGSD
jgi:hypothetical protein